jgi:hypothetical protein
MRFKRVVPEIPSAIASVAGDFWSPVTGIGPTVVQVRVAQRGKP